MALTSPILDDRSFSQLRDELIARIPVYAPNWTDHNTSDPGIALLELFAYLGEALLYRFNQIPETARIEFLRLLGVAPRPARPARLLIAASTDIPAGSRVGKGTVASAGSVSFQTEAELYAWPVQLLGAGKTPQAPENTKAGRESSADALARAGLVDPAAAQFYRTAILPADPMAPDAVLVDVSAQVDKSLWVAVLHADGSPITELAGRSLFVGVAFEETFDPPEALESLDAGQFRADGLQPAAPPMVWQIWDPVGGLSNVPVLGDTTGGMVRTGVLELQLPQPMPNLTGAVSAGGADSPPPLADDKLARQVIGWLRVSRPKTADIGDTIKRVRWVGANAVSAVQSRTAPVELLGTGTGDADQRYPLNQHPVLPKTIELQVEEPDGWQPWLEVDNFAASGMTDRHFTVDYNQGAVQFGRRRVPQLGERIRVVGYQYGGGLVGNVAATNPLPATGGADPASVPEALEQIPAHVHRHDRAVIAEDFTALARQITGVARAEALPLLYPDSPAEPAAGVVSVVVFPAEDQRDPAAPTPDLGLLRQVAGHLDAARLITTELYVIPPTYVPIAVSVGVAVRTGYQVDAVRRWVEQILRQYLSPLPPFGPDGDGWPLGRTVRRAELAAVAVQVEGVEYLHDLKLATVGSSEPVPRETIELQRWQSPKVLDLSVVSGPPLAPGEAYEPDPPAKPPVPLPLDVC
jgi:predicted phage baseplate assembly protein